MKARITTVIALSTILTACGDRDLEYYQSNLDSAETKVQQCQKDMEAAFSKRDEKGLKAVSEDLECNFADKAVRDHKSKIARLKREKERAEREQKRITAEKAFNEEYQKQLSQLEAMTYEEFAANSEKCTSYSNRIPLCKAFRELEAPRKDKEVTLLISKYSGEELDTMNKECKSVWPKTPNCQIINMSIRKAEADQVSAFLENKPQLVSDFNSCQKQFSTLNKSNKYQEASLFTQTFPCRTASQAARKLGVYGFSRPIKL
mgnify:CR=1 FL=1